jgi:CelD/BcsL family acetyltransferase involved in cellulose biosynthesis
VLEPRTEHRLGFPVDVWGMLRLSQQPVHADFACPDDEARRLFAPLLAEHLRRHPEGRPLLVLGPLERGAAFWAGLDRLAPADLCVDPNDRVRVVDCRQPFAQLEARCTRNFRHQMKAARKRLAELPEAACREARGDAALARELPVFLEVEASGWKGQGGTSIRHQRGMADFYAHLAGALAGVQDFAAIHALYAGDRCIASAFTTRTGATCSLPKIAYDEAYGRLSPGHLLVAHLLEDCCADPGIERVHCLAEAPWLHGWPSDLLDLQVVFVNIGGPVGRVLTTLLRFRFGPLRRLVRRLQRLRSGSGRA